MQIIKVFVLNKNNILCPKNVKLYNSFSDFEPNEANAVPH